MILYANYNFKNNLNKADTNIEWGKRRFTVVHMENNTITNKQWEKNKLLHTYNCKLTHPTPCSMLHGKSATKRNKAVNGDSKCWEIVILERGQGKPHWESDILVKTFQRLGKCCTDNWRRALQAAQIVCAKALRQECVWRIWSGLSKWKCRKERSSGK